MWLNCRDKSCKQHAEFCTYYLSIRHRTMRSMRINLGQLKQWPINAIYRNFQQPQHRAPSSLCGSGIITLYEYGSVGVGQTCGGVVYNCLILLQFMSQHRSDQQLNVGRDSTTARETCFSQRQAHKRNDWELTPYGRQVRT